MNYHNITKDDMLNGDGLRVVLWVAGCSHQCPGCHNQETWDEFGGIPFDDEAKQEIFAELEKGYVSGITFSGGDPLFCSNREVITALAKEIKEKYPDKTIWLYSGYVYEQVKDIEIMQYVDVFVDGPFVQSLLDPQLKWKGSSNQKVIDMNKTRCIGSIVLYADNNYDAIDDCRVGKSCGCGF